jgi:hypothetical protein
MPLQAIMNRKTLFDLNVCHLKKNPPPIPVTPQSVSEIKPSAKMTIHLHDSFAL